MQLVVAPLKPCPGRTIATRPSVRRHVVVMAQPEDPVSRRSAIASLAAVSALFATAPALALGTDYRQALKAKDARKQKLKESAAKMRASQKTDQAFSDSKYQLPEDATTPNMRTLANDRLRKED